MAKRKFDTFHFGFIPGLVAPVAGMFIYYLLMFRYMGLQSFISHLINAGLLVSVMSLGVILNLILFFMFYRVEADRAARGVIAATFIYAFIVVYFKVLR